MLPAYPPFPACWNFPFQVAAIGSHTSNLISESAVGRAMP